MAIKGYKDSAKLRHSRPGHAKSSQKNADVDQDNTLDRIRRLNAKIAKAGDIDALQKFYMFMDNFRNPSGGKHVAERPAWTHAMTHGPRGAYNIPDDMYATFLQYYQAAVLAGFEPHVTENHREFGPIVIDLDFEQAATDNQRFYTKTTITNLVTIYNHIIQKYLDVTSQKMTAYVTEKARPTLRGGKIHDGIHIVYPHICTKPHLQILMRKEFLEQIERRKILRNIPHTNPIEKVVDSAVICQVGWMLYGSKKDPAYDGYKITHIFHRAGGKLYDLILPGQDLSSPKLVRDLILLLSCRKFSDERDLTPLAPNVDHLELQQQVKTLTDALPRTQRREIANLTGGNMNVINAVSEKKLAEARNLVRLFSRARSDDYHTWMQVGQCLFNIDYRLLDDWTEFSRKSDKFQPGECARLWRHMRNNNYTMASLHYFASQDDNEGYLQLKRRKVDKLIKDVTEASHGAIAKILMAKYQYNFKCANIKSNVWYEFKNHRWHEIDSAYSLRNLIREEIIEEFTKRQSYLYSLAKDKKSQSKQKKIYTKAADISRIISRLNDSTFKNGVIRDCCDMAHDANFLRRLDENPNLICFSNGVFDLKLGIFREGCPDDNISMCTNYQYIDYDPNDAMVAEIDDFFQKIQPDPVMREYVLNLLATCLSGNIFDQSFYILTGSGANGKSRLMELMRHTLGDYHKPMDVRIITQRRGNSSGASPELADKKGVRLCPFDEPEATSDMNTSFMKYFTGGEDIVARGLFRDPVYFRPQFKPFMLTNDLPNVRGDDEGTWRRIKVIDFVAKFYRRGNPPRHVRRRGLGPNEHWADDELSNRLPEWREIFAGMLIHRYLEIHNGRGLVHPKQVLKATAAYRRKCDVYQDFVADYLEKTDRKRHVLPVLQLHEGMRNWYRANYDGKCPCTRDLRCYLKSKMTEYFDNKRDVLTHHKIRGFDDGTADLDEIE